MSLISYGKQFLDRNDLNSVKNVLKSDYLTQGPIVKKFEIKLKEKLGSKYCTVVANGSAALHLLGLALNWKKGDVILTTPNSFVATSNCILYSNATPVFVDIDKNTGNICPSNLEKKITLLTKKSKKIKAVIAIDYGGQPSDWPRLKSIVKKKNIILINDGCHSLGSSINKDKKYANKYADFVTYSFHPVKPITTGEGGAILTNNKKIDNKLKELRTHGITKKKNPMWYYDMNSLGYNYRITDFQCALGISQLNKLDKFNLKRKNLAKIYDKAFKDFKFVETPSISEKKDSSYHLYPLRIDFKKLKLNKNKFFKKLLDIGIKLQVHYIPIYKHSYYKKNFKYKSKQFPCAEEFYKKVVSLPIYYSLSNTKQEFVIKSLKKLITKSSN